jgi:dihydrodipicolinate synthase/N-acetylneuraminate lyase
MDYSASNDQFADLVASQVSLVDGRAPIYAGIGATAVKPAMTAEQVLEQIHTARSLGASGFSIFNLDARTIETLVPGVGRGLKTATTEK